MFVLKMFYKHLIATGFQTHHFKMVLKCFGIIIFICDIFLTFVIKHLINGTHMYPSFFNLRQMQRCLLGNLLMQMNVLG